MRRCTSSPLPPKHNKSSFIPTINDIKKNPYIGLLRHDKKNLSDTNINSYYLDNDIDYIEYSDDEYEGYDSCYETYESIIKESVKELIDETIGLKTDNEENFQFRVGNKIFYGKITSSKNIK